jgi:uncharacterized protein YndB with AHSA1/START domain
MENSRIEKQITIAAPISRVWRALTDHQQFGEWFRVKLDGPFTPGQPSTGFMTWPGYEHVQWNAIVQKIEPERFFSFTWHPYALDPNRDYSTELPTLVEFTLEPSNGATILSVVESGFEHIPAERRAEAFLRNSGGWAQQMENINTYVLATA